MKFTEISATTYDQFASQHAHNNFLNGTASLQSKSADWVVKFVALYDNNEIIAATGLIFVPTLRKFHYAYAQRGFLIDYHNKELVTIFTQNLTSYLKQQKISYLKLDPYVIYQVRDIDGNSIENAPKNDDAIHNLTSNNYIHQGFTRGYNNKQCRWMSTLHLKDQTQEEVFNRFNPSVKREINTAHKINVQIRRLAYEELHIIKEIVDATGERQHFDEYPLSYFERQYTIHKECADVYLAYINLDDYIQSIHQDLSKQEEILMLAKERLVATPNSKKMMNRVKESEQAIIKLSENKEEASILTQKHGNELRLAASLFVSYGDEVVYLTSGSFDEFKKFKGPYALQWYVIQKAIEEGYKTYNFYGISGYFNSDEAGYGVFSFKRGFKADVVELIGEFILPINQMSYQFLNKLNKI